MTTSLKQTTITNVQSILVILLLVNTIIGSFWFYELLNQKKTKHEEFVLRNEYFIQGSVLLTLTWIFFGIGAVVLVKIIIIFIKEDRAARRRFYGRFTDEEDLTKPSPDAIVETYFRFLEKFPYEEKTQDYKICQLCKKEFEDGQMVVRVPQCGHILRVDCMKTWLLQKQKCPVCKINLICMPKNASPSQ